MSLADEESVLRLIEMAREEDLGAGDLTTNLIVDPTQQATFRLIAKEPGVFAGCEIAPAVLETYDESTEIEWSSQGRDGAAIDVVPADLAVIRGPIAAILSAERVVLNFLQRLCGVATLTRRYVEAVAGTRAKIFDTRKTTPGWRHLEKYAIRCGGGSNHRRGLYDAVLIKDNHLAGVETGGLAGTIVEMLNVLSRSDRRPAFVEVEADNLTQVEELLKVVGIDVILLDNFSLDELGEAVALRDRHGAQGTLALEASGGVTLETVRAVAETGVDRISVGALTHSATAIDLSMERS